MARSTTSSGGTHDGNKGAAVAATAASIAGGVYPSHEGTHDGSRGTVDAGMSVAGGVYHSAHEGTHDGSKGTAAAAAASVAGVYHSAQDGSHDGSRGAAAAGMLVAGVYLSARAIRARERQAKTSACHLYSGRG